MCDVVERIRNAGKTEGRTEVLGLWLADTEGAKFWTRSPRERTVK